MDEAFSHDILDALPTAVVVVDASGLVRFGNRRMQRILGACHGEMVLREGEQFARVGDLLGFSAESAGALQAALDAVLRGDCQGFHVEIEVSCARLGLYYLAEGEAVDSPHGRAAVIELRDTSDEQRRNRATERRLRLLQALLDAIPSPLFYKDEEGIYRGCNTAFEAYIGLPRERVVGSSVYDVAPKDLADTYHAMDLALMAERGVQIYEAQVRYADGSRHDVVFHKAAVLDEDEDVVGLVGVMLDITQRKRTESELRRREEALGEQNRKLSTPILSLGNGTLALPIIGAIDAERGALIMQRLLEATSASRAHAVIIDVTGVEEMGSEVAEHLSRLSRAVELLGARCYLTGIGPDVARAMVALGADLGGAQTLRSIAEALVTRRGLRARP